MLTRNEAGIGRQQLRRPIVRRPRRFLSLTVLAMAAAGLGMLLAGLHYLGLFAIMASSLVSGWKRTQGTFVDTLRNRDEREKDLFVKASLVGSTGAFALAFFALLYLGLVVPSPELANRSIAQTYGHALWFPRNFIDWLALAIGLQAMQSGITLIWANWKVPADPTVWDDD